jgi:hypothetical protein
VRKETKKYYFSVEGETEKMYIDRLQSIINAESGASYCVKFDCKVQKNPVKRAKGIIPIGKVDITHVFDYESNDVVHIQQFEGTLANMKAAGSLGKHIKYHLGYSNFTFELWMILHKKDCKRPFSHRNQYLLPLNQAYNEHFESLDEYKEADNFERVLKKISLNNVREAVRRAIAIMENNEESGLRIVEYKGYRYYRENPSISLGKIFGDILAECGLL